jgi:hypothetical protein
VAFLKKQEMENLTDQIRCKGRYYKIHSPWELQDRYNNKLFIHVGNGYKIAYKFSAFTLDKQYITVISAPKDRRYFLAAGKIQVNGYKVTLEEYRLVDITHDFYEYPNFDSGELGSVEAAYNADCKCFCAFDLSCYRVAFFWKLYADSNNIIIKDLNKELYWIEDMSIEIKEGSLSIIDENQIQLAGTRRIETEDEDEEEEEEEYYTTDVVITYDFSLRAIVSIE